MPKKKSLNRKKLNPLTPVFTGVKHSDNLNIQLFKYNKDEYLEDVNFSENDFKEFSDTNFQHWLNTHGIHDVEKITNLCKKLNIHDLVIQDILDVNQRPKFQEFDNYWFFSTKSILPSKTRDIEDEQLSFIIGANFLISFQEKKGDYFEHIRYRLRENIGIVRERGADYLLYLLLESLLDNYFKTLERIDAEVEKFEIIDINSDPSPEILNTIESYKRQINFIKKTIIPIKEIVSKVEREQFHLIQKKHIKYYFELKDLSLTLLDICDQILSRLESSINLFFSVQGHRMNMVMKTLTVISSIFIPLTFIAGVYGMNFVNIPELNLQWGYFAVWGVMVIIFVLMLFYFKKKKWY
ncbi:magnesium/cobalt transporter CorA [Lutibacter sp.]|uniref:magnesium/cobalt transporter CorA n=1 Tax=Lutibacter sp. TaxID=1925666 RepID=UPI003563EC95